MLPGHLIGATGAGDVKLFAAVGALHRSRCTSLTAFFYTALAGGVMAIVVSLRRRRLRQHARRHGAADRDGGRERAGD